MARDPSRFGLGDWLFTYIFLGCLVSDFSEITTLPSEPSINNIIVFFTTMLFTDYKMLSLNTGVLIIVAAYICHLYRSSARQAQVLEQNVKSLRDKVDKLEKGETGKEICLAGMDGVGLKVDLSRLRRRMAHIEAEVGRVEKLIKAHKEEDQEHKLCMIEGIKKITGFLGHDQVVFAEAVEEAIIPGSKDGHLKLVEEAPMLGRFDDTEADSVH